MKYLTKTVETYRVATEEEAAKIIEEAKHDRGFTLAKYEAVHKEKKSKGEVVDEWVRVTLHKVFNDEAEPSAYIGIEYNREDGYFPEPKVTYDNDEENDSEDGVEF